MSVKCELDLVEAGIADISIQKDRDLDQDIVAIYNSGTTELYFEFSGYTGATLEVRNNANSTAIILSFSTTDGSIVLGDFGVFNLNKTADELANIRASNYVYDMYLTSSTKERRGFLIGDFIIKDRVTR